LEPVDRSTGVEHASYLGLILTKSNIWPPKTVYKAMRGTLAAFDAGDREPSARVIGTPLGGTRMGQVGQGVDSSTSTQSL
jgi:hypothetical protein